MTKSITFGEHLIELRKRVLISLGALVVGSCATFFYSEKIIKFLLRPIQSEINEVYFFSPTEAFVIKVKVAIFSGLILAFPIIAAQFWLFFSPALRDDEKKMVLPLVLFTLTLFLTGVWFSFSFVVTPALHFLVGANTGVLKPLISIKEYLDFLIGFLFAFGVSFNLPVFILAFVFAGVMDWKSLAKYRRHAILAIFIASAILTPGPDIASQLFLAVPLLFLFELSVFLAWVLGKFKKGRTSH